MPPMRPSLRCLAWKLEREPHLLRTDGTLTLVLVVHQFITINFDDGLVIGFTSVPRSEVECCANNQIHVSSECHYSFPEIRELLRQMGSGLVVTK